MRRVQVGCGLVTATIASMALTVVAFGEALAVGGRAWLAVALGAVLFCVCLAAISRSTRSRR